MVAWEKVQNAGFWARVVTGDVTGHLGPESSSNFYVAGFQARVYPMIEYIEHAAFIYSFAL
jgi:hypothetical protein